jgi:hypothetical protein
MTQIEFALLRNQQTIMEALIRLCADDEDGKVLQPLRHSIADTDELFRAEIERRS